MRRADIEVPNTTVAMNARVVLACYPRGNFYPLNNGASTRHQKVTKPRFRDCSTCQSCSKAPLCLYTLRLISIQSEGTLGILRYSLVRDRPNQTTHLAMFGCPETNYVESGHKILNISVLGSKVVKDIRLNLYILSILIIICVYLLPQLLNGPTT